MHVYKTIREHVEVSEKLIEKVHSTLKSLDILISHYDSELTDLRNTVYEFSESLKWNHISFSNLDGDPSGITFRNEERRVRIEELQVELSRERGNVILIK